jgi:molybdopterin converting factor subunit 1
MITVFFFASAKEAAGVSVRTFDYAGPLTLHQLSGALCREYPSLAPLMPSLRYAVNQTITDLSSLIADGDEIAVLPPVSGG